MSFLRDEVFTSQQMKEEMEQALHLGARGWAGCGPPRCREGRAGSRGIVCRWTMAVLREGVRSTHIWAEAEPVGAVTRRES